MNYYLNCKSYMLSSERALLHYRLSNSHKKSTVLLSLFSSSLGQSKYHFIFCLYLIKSLTTSQMKYNRSKISIANFNLKKKEVYGGQSNVNKKIFSFIFNFFSYSNLVNLYLLSTKSKKNKSISFSSKNLIINETLAEKYSNLHLKTGFQISIK